MTTIDLEDVKIKLYEKLKPSGWGNILKTFILSSEFDRILEELLRQARDGKRFTPVIKYLFRAFEECPYDTTKVIVFGQDPYPYPNVADGIAFSCSVDGKIQPSLRYIYKEIKETIYKDKPFHNNPDLKYLSNQGVLLLNTALTTTTNKIGSHYKLWQPFIAFLLDNLAFSREDITYVFLGKKAAEWGESIPNNFCKIFETHPASAAHNKDERWVTKDLFNNINECCIKNGHSIINW